MAQLPKDQITLDKLQLSCRNFEEMIDPGITGSLGYFPPDSAPRTMSLVVGLKIKLLKVHKFVLVA